MKLSCSIAEDLLPLYLEGACSQESTAAIEAHLQACPACREKKGRMERDNVCVRTEQSVIEMAAFSRKVKWHRIRIGILAAVACICLACVLFVVFLTIQDMHAQANPTVYTVEDGVYNLTAQDLQTTSEEVEAYRFYTNYEQIQVQILGGDTFTGELLLWDVTDAANPDIILYGNVDPQSNACIFSNLTAARRYGITCQADQTVRLLVSEGRTVGFWDSMGRVLDEIFTVMAQ